MSQPIMSTNMAQNERFDCGIESVFKDRFFGGRRTPGCRVPSSHLKCGSPNFPQTGLSDSD
jgi:hypothetical protein